MPKTMYRQEKIAHARRMIARGELNNAEIRRGLQAVFGSAISPTELGALRREVNQERRQAHDSMPGAPIVLNPDGTWEYLQPPKVRTAGNEPTI